MKFLFFIILHFLSCCVANPIQENDLLKVQSSGYVKLIDENDRYAILAKNDIVYLPLNLNSKFKKNGLKVVF